MLRSSLPPLVAATVCFVFASAPPPATVGDELLGLGETPAAARTTEEFFTKADINGDGALTGKELKDVHEYDDLDLDGAVSREEYVAMRAREQRLLAEVRKQREIEEAFRDRDRSEDEVLTGNEKVGYESLDVDLDGRITPSEFRVEAGAALRAKLAAASATTSATAGLDSTPLGGEVLGGAPSTKPRGDSAAAEDLKTFQSLDGNEDGKLSGTELEGYEEDDADGNKRVTRDEFLQGRAKRRLDPQTKIAEVLDRGSSYFALAAVSNYVDQSLPWTSPGADLIWTNLRALNSKKVLGVVRVDSGQTENPLTKEGLQGCFAGAVNQVVEADVSVFVFTGRVTSIDGRGFLCPLGFDAEQPFATGYSIEELIAAIDKHKTARKLLIIEGVAFEPTAAGEKKAPTAPKDGRQSPEKEKRPSRPVLDEAFSAPLAAVHGLTTVLSCSPGEVSTVSPRRNYGACLDAVATALSGKADYGADGIVDSDELFTYLVSAVPHAARKSTPDGRQTPRRIIGREARGAFGLVRYRASKRPLDVAQDAGKSKFPKDIKNVLGQLLIRFEPAKFWVGSHAETPFRGRDEWLRKAQLTTSFYISKYEVTQGQFEAVMKSNLSFHGPEAKYPNNHPVEQVSWLDAVEFCKRLSEVPSEVAAGRRYRLPTEFEWERAAGTDAHDPGEFRHFHTGSTITSEQANIRGDRPYADSPPGTSLGRTQICGSYPPNQFGICDMHGNVSEWCADWYADDHLAYGDPTHFVVDSRGAQRGTRKSVRGGDFETEVTRCRGASREAFEPDYTYKSLGFRVVCDVLTDPTARKEPIAKPDQGPK